MSKPIPFRVQSHVLKLLGDELIGHDRLAVFELVKNAYDACATEVKVTLQLDEVPPKITVLDNGFGMSEETIENSWLEIGTDSKRKDRDVSRAKCGRLPLGEKGVGRLAIQKLGNHVRIFTKELNSNEYEFSIDWVKLINSGKYLEGGLVVDVDTNSPPKVFGSSGTLIEITELYRAEWSRREIRDLYRLVTSLNNPFDEVSSFKVELKIPGREHEIADLPTLQQMLDAAIWKFEFDLNEKDGLLAWKYSFNPPRFKNLKARVSSEEKVKEKLSLVETDEDDLEVENQSHLKKIDQQKIFLQPNDLKGIGSISGEIYAFHRRDEILNASGAPQQIKKWLDNQTGVRVYRDKIRVFNYGEPNDDWLGLDARRINRPTGKLGTQSVIAQVSLSLESSYLLKEKTNREGFDENEAFLRLRRIVISIFDKFQREHAVDRKAIDIALKGEHETPAIQEAMANLQKLARKHNIEDDVKPILGSIQAELNTFREIMVSSGIAGMNLALIFHEIVHTIDRVKRKLDKNATGEEVRQEVDHLRKLLDTFKPLLQRDPPRKVPVAELVDRASGMHADRFKRHNIAFSNWLTDHNKSDSFNLTIPRGLVVGALSNVIDNAIYWTRFRRERDERDTPGAILITSAWIEDKGPILIVADNGPGFQLPLDQLGLPFTSTRAGGMGLGVFYCKTVMESIGGKLEVTSVDALRELIDLPEAYDGTAVIFSFKNE